MTGTNYSQRDWEACLGYILGKLIFILLYESIYYNESLSGNNFYVGVAPIGSVIYRGEWWVLAFFV